jgi:hypothetical protein
MPTPADRAAAERSLAGHLIAFDPDGVSHAFVLAGDATRLTLGRNEVNDLVVDWDREVSRTHAQFERVGQYWTVMDDGISRNGTRINGERLVGRRRLEDRDVLRVGTTDLLFRAPSADDDATALPAGRMQVRLTPAQRKVLVALARPYAGGGFPTPASNQAIAAELVIGLDAVRGHLRALFGKFALGKLPQNQKRARLVEQALELGVITLHDLR